MAWLLPDGGPLRVPGIDGVFGFGFIGFIDGPGMGESVDGGGMPGVEPPPITRGIAML